MTDDGAVGVQNIVALQGLARDGMSFHQQVESVSFAVEYT